MPSVKLSPTHTITGRIKSLLNEEGGIACDEPESMILVKLVSFLYTSS